MRKPVHVILNSVLLVGTMAWLAAASAESMPGRLSPCPSTPNCVSSDATDDVHQVAPFEPVLPYPQVWKQLSEVVTGLPRTNIQEQTDRYLRAECRSAVFRFVDVLELEWRTGAGVIAVRSAARTGRYDFGVNRRRVERLRSELQSRGVIR